MYKLLQKRSIEFLQKNAESALQNLTQFSFSDLEIVSKSGQTVCAKLADKMRRKMLDEELPDIDLSIQGELNLSDSALLNKDIFQVEGLRTFLLDSMKEKTKDITDALPMRAGQNYIKIEDLKDLKRIQRGQDSNLEFKLEKGLLKILFPEGFNLKNIELNGGMQIPIGHTQGSCTPIDEQPSEDEKYKSDNPHMKGKIG